jgi:hypothetical protein
MQAEIHLELILRNNKCLGEYQEFGRGKQTYRSWL